MYLNYYITLALHLMYGCTVGTHVLMHTISYMYIRHLWFS